MSKIAVIGTGYVGLTTGACFAHIGHEVICADVDADKVERLQRGEIPMTTRPPPATASTSPSGSASEVVASTSTTRWTASEASASRRLASRRPLGGSARVPTSRSGAPVAEAIQRRFDDLPRLRQPPHRPVDPAAFERLRVVAEDVQQ